MKNDGKIGGLALGRKKSQGRRKNIERMITILVMMLAICDRPPVEPFRRDPAMSALVGNGKFR